MSAKLFLAVIETQQVKGYLFASPYLSETRGAGLLLDRLNRIETRRLLERYTSHECICLAGGSGRVLFGDRSSADDFAGAVRNLYLRHVVDAHLSVAVVERLQDESMGAWIARGVNECRMNNPVLVDAVPDIVGCWIRPCSSCGKEAAQEITSDAHGVHRLCRSCLAKRKEISEFFGHEAGGDRDSRLPSAELLRSERPDSILTILSEKLSGAWLEPPRLPRDFDQIGAASRPGNYIGLICAGGNRIGEAIKSIGRLFPDDDGCAQGCRAFAEIADRSVREAAVDAVLKHVPVAREATGNGEADRYIPAELVFAEGDNVILIVPGDAAIPAAVTFVEQFQERTRTLQARWPGLPGPFAQEGLAASAGVVIAHSSFPAGQLVEMAADLLKLAKARSADLAGAGRTTGTLDFMVVHDSGSRRIRDRRRNEYTMRSGGGEIALTERPYTAAELSKLLDRIRALKRADIPSNRIKALYPVLFQGELQAQFDGLRLKERLKATGALAPGSELESLVSELTRFPFRVKDLNHWSTPWTELIEIYDFVQPESRAEQG